MKIAFTIFASVIFLVIGGVAFAGGAPVLSLNQAPVTTHEMDRPISGRDRARAQQLRGSVQNVQHFVSVDFVENSGGVVAIQFDLKLSASHQVDLTNCGQGVPATHNGYCSQKSENTIRVLIESPTNAELLSSNIGIADLPAGISVSIVENSVVMGNIRAQQVQAELMN